MYRVARDSTVRMIVDEIEALGGVGYIDWDAHAEEFKLPDTDLTGIVGFSLTQEGKFHDIVCGIGIVTQTDSGIVRLTDLVDHFYNRLSTGARYDIFDNAGDKIGVATCFDGTTVSPTASVDTRPAQTLSFTARLVPDGV